MAAYEGFVMDKRDINFLPLISPLYSGHVFDLLISDGNRWVDYLKNRYGSL
jgi:hypothetical protein